MLVLFFDNLHILCESFSFMMSDFVSSVSLCLFAWIVVADFCSHYKYPWQQNFRDRDIVVCRANFIRVSVAFKQTGRTFVLTAKSTRWRRAD